MMQATHFSLAAAEWAATERGSCAVSKILDNESRGQVLLHTDSR